jgi:hypothetical protein
LRSLPFSYYQHAVAVVVVVVAVVAVVVAVVAVIHIYEPKFLIPRLLE